MGKISKHGPKKATSATNKHKERECEDRKEDLKKRIELKRMLSEIDYLKDELRGLHVKEMKIDPLYDLRGPARAARESYPDPKLANQPQVINYMEQSAGQLWEVPQGSELLTKMKAYAEACISLLGRTLDAIQVLEEMIDYDLQDHLVRTLSQLNPSLATHCLCFTSSVSLTYPLPLHLSCFVS